MSVIPPHPSTVIETGDSHQVFELKAALSASLAREEALKRAADDSRRQAERLRAIVGDLRLQLLLAKMDASPAPTPEPACDADSRMSDAAVSRPWTRVRDCSVTAELESRLRATRISPCTVDPVEDDDPMGDAVDDTLLSRFKRLRVDEPSALMSASTSM
jgi:hypothetical protein